MKVKCHLCPRNCLILPGKSGSCRIRVNLDGKLKTVTYGYPVSVHVDPIEKKPLYHFLPGSKIFSLATAGCTLHCKNCQNWEISQADPASLDAFKLFPEEIPALTKKENCLSVAYTYTDPAAYYEYALDSSKIVRKENLRNVLVTAGYINPAPWGRLLDFTDGVTLDLKAFSDTFYRDVCDGRLMPVLDSLVMTRKKGVHLEVSNLLIPGLNDSDKMILDLVRWHKENLGREVPLHFLRFYPMYLMKNLPETPASTLERARRLAMNEGLYYVYVGNFETPEGSNTYCPKCKKAVIVRRGHQVLENHVRAGTCAFCSERIYGVWTDAHFLK